MSEISKAFDEAQRKINKAVLIQTVKILFEKILKFNDSDFEIVDYVCNTSPYDFKHKTKLRIAMKNGLSITIEE